MNKFALTLAFVLATACASHDAPVNVGPPLHDVGECHPTPRNPCP